MHTLNIRVGSTQNHIKLVNNLYKDSLKNILDSNIDNIMAKIVYIKSGLLKQKTSII